MKFICFLLAVTFCCTLSIAQRKKTETLLQEIKSGNDSIKAKSYYQLSKNFLRVSLDSCRLFANKSLEYSIPLKMEKYIGEAYSVLGSAEKYNGNFEEAIKFHLKASKIKETMNDTIGMSICNNDIGILYKNMKRYKEALPYYRRSLNYSQMANYGKGISMTLSNIGTIFNEINQSDSAIFYYDSALSKATIINDSNCIVNAMANVGEYYGNKEMPEKALPYFLKCLPIDMGFDDQYGVTLDYLNIGGCYMKMKNYNEANKYLELAEKACLQGGMTNELVNVYNSKSVLFHEQNNDSKAFYYLTKSKELHDSLLNSESNMQVSELNTKYETAKKEQKIEKQKFEITRRNYWIGGILGMLVAICLLAVSRYKRLKIKDEAKLNEALFEQKTLATKSILEAEERERRRIALDLHDGVGQLMTAAKMNLGAFETKIKFENESQKIGFDRIISLLEESSKEVRMVAHNMMPNVLIKKGLSNAVQEFLNKIDHQALKVNLHAEGISQPIDGNVESVLYRVIQECFNNVMKHAQASQLDISIIHDSEGISTTVEDNGKGFNQSSKIDYEGIGLKNIKSRIEYLNGTVDIDSAPGRGTLVALFVPTTNNLSNPE